MRAVLVLLLCAALAVNVGLPGPAQAQVPPGILPTPPPAGNTTNETAGNGTVVPLYLSATPGSVGNLTDVQTLTRAPPTGTENRLRGAAGGVAWYLPGGFGGQALLGSTVAGTLGFVVTGAGSVPVGAFAQASVVYELRRVAPDGQEIILGTASDSFSLSASPLATPQDESFTITLSNATLGAGDTLALNVSATLTPAVTGDLAVVYDSTGHPSGFNVTLLPVPVRGGLQLTSAGSAKDVAPGASATYSVVVRNTGEAVEQVRVNATGTPLEWAVRINLASFSLQPNLTQTVLVTVTSPAGSAEGAKHEAAVVATGSSGIVTPPLALATTVRAAASVCQVGGLADTDCDGWSDRDEQHYASNRTDPRSTPESEDSDRDGWSNKAEIDAGTDYLDPADRPGGGSRPGGNAGGGLGALAPLSSAIGQATGLDAATSDLLAVVLVVLFLVILILLILLVLNAYPVKVSLIEASATTEPGRSVDFSVQVASRLGKSQAVDLEVAELPPEWEVRLTQSHLQLGPKARESVGLLVRPPDGWPAPSRREFQVRARSRLKPRSFARAVARMLIQPVAAPLPPPPAEEAVPEPPAFPEETTAVVPPEEAFAEYRPPPARVVPAPAPEAPPAPAYAPPPPVAGRGLFRVAIAGVTHNPPVPQRGGEVTTTARLENQGAEPERIRVVLVVNGKIRDEVTTQLAPGEGAEAEFRWVAYLARNDVKVVAERQPAA